MRGQCSRCGYPGPGATRELFDGLCRCCNMTEAKRQKEVELEVQRHNLAWAERRLSHTSDITRQDAIRAYVDLTCEPTYKRKRMLAQDALRAHVALTSDPVKAETVPVNNDRQLFADIARQGFVSTTKRVELSTDETGISLLVAGSRKEAEEFAKTHNLKAYCLCPSSIKSAHGPVYFAAKDDERATRHAEKMRQYWGVDYVLYNTYSIFDKENK